MRKFYTKKIQFVFLLVLVFSGISHLAKAQVGQSGWTFSNPQPFNFSSIGASFINDNTGIFAGDAGGIGRTTDGGATWQHFSYFRIDGTSLIKPIFYDAQMVDNSVAFACGSSSTLIKSVDGGINWTRVNTPFNATPSNIIRSLYFLNANLGYIVGDTILGTPGPALYKTLDGGTTWNQEPNLPRGPYRRVGVLGSATNPLRYDTSEAGNIYKVRFVNENLGYVSGQRGLLWKYDGTGWKDYSITNDQLGLDTTNSNYRPNTGPQIQNWSALNIISDSVVVSLSFNNNIIVRTNTAGPTPVHRMTNWANQAAIVFPQAIIFSNPQHLLRTAAGDLVTVAGSSAGRFYISKDTGITWQTSQVYPDASPYGAIGISAVAITPGGRFVFGGSSGIIADSMSGSWRRPYVNTNLGSAYSRIRFPDKDNGAIVGANGSIAITKDNGATWMDKSNLADRAGFISYFAMDYPSTDALFIATSQGIVRLSTDQGATFDQIFVDDYKTSSSSSNPPIYAMDWIDKNKGWLVSYRGHNTATRESTIFFTKNGGANWDSVKTAFPIGLTATPRINDIVFANELVGYAAGTRGTVWKTIDGGLTWNRSWYGADSATANFSRLSLVDANTVWVVGNGSRVMRTLDGGQTWQDAKGDFPITTNFLGVKAYDLSQVFVTAGNMMYFTKDGGGHWEPYSAAVGGVGVFMEDIDFTPLNPGCGSEVCNSLWMVGSNATILKFGSDKILPIKFSNLTGSPVSDGNQLFWTSFDQNDVKQFEVEGSRDGRKFETLEARIVPNSLPSSSYNWLHKGATGGKYYYRVKAVEKSGATFYTNVLALDNRNITGWKYQVVANSLVLTNAQALRGDVNVQVVSASGQVMAAKNWKQSGGAFNDLMNLPHHAHGIYFIRVVNEGYTQTFRVLIP